VCGTRCGASGQVIFEKNEVHILAGVPDPPARSFAVLYWGRHVVGSSADASAHQPENALLSLSLLSYPLRQPLNDHPPTGNEGRSRSCKDNGSDYKKERLKRK